MATSVVDGSQHGMKYERHKRWHSIMSPDINPEISSDLGLSIVTVVISSQLVAFSVCAHTNPMSKRENHIVARRLSATIANNFCFRLRALTFSKLLSPAQKEECSELGTDRLEIACVKLPSSKSP